MDTDDHDDCRFKDNSRDSNRKVPERKNGLDEARV